jgi:uncharacterized protein (UPF0276 family)
MRTLTAGLRGLGLRPEFVDSLLGSPAVQGLDFLEVAPENWMQIGVTSATRSIAPPIASH